MSSNLLFHIFSVLISVIFTFSMIITLSIIFIFSIFSIVIVTISIIITFPSLSHSPSLSMSVPYSIISTTIFQRHPHHIQAGLPNGIPFDALDFQESSLCMQQILQHAKCQVSSFYARRLLGRQESHEIVARLQ